MSAEVRPPFDPELEEPLKRFPVIPLFTRENVHEVWKALNDTNPAKTMFGELKLIPGPTGDLILADFRRKNSSETPRPAMYFLHGSGMVLGDRFMIMVWCLDWIKQLDVVLISFEFTNAPENTVPQVEECFAGLKWVAEQHSELGTSPEKVVVTGASGGGNPAGATTLATRDRGGPKICAQLLCYPTLDDRMETFSYKQFANKGLWLGEHSVASWTFYLENDGGTKDASIYEAPARATDLSGLPPTWLDVGLAELFRDGVVAYASTM
jgi:acetyl esterase/lipase